MSKADHYRQVLPTVDDWEAFLLAESGLPGPRGNLELAHIVAEMGDEAFFQHLLTYTADQAPVNTPQEYLAFCGAVGLGRVLAEGKTDHLATLRDCASDPRWRMREAVVMGLWYLGQRDMPRLIQAMAAWSAGNWLEKRAAAASLCQPDLLRDPDDAAQALHILDTITASIEDAADRKSDAFKAFRKGMAYCWSVAVVAHPTAGKPLMEKWLASADKDIGWIMKENLKKTRLERLDADWVAAHQREIGS